MLTITQAWSLRVKLFYYLAMILLTRNIKIVVAWFILSVIYIFYLEYSLTPFIERYTTTLGASISFSLGALVYQLSKKISLGKCHLYIALILFSLHLWFAPNIWSFPRLGTGFSMFYKIEHYSLYSCIILGAYLLAAITSNEVRSDLNLLGSRLGNLATQFF